MRRLFASASLILVLSFGISTTAKVLAQESPAGTTDPAPAPVASRPTGSTPSVNQLPHDPRSFTRGNSSVVPNDFSSVFGVTRPAVPQRGWYINLFGFVLIVCVFFLWAHTTYWVDEDARALKVGSLFWNGVMILSGFAGFLLVFIMPNFLLGLLILLTSYALPFSLYVKEHNDRVPEASKIFTPRHIRQVATRMLARIGINIGGGEGYAGAGGPPIEFIGKSDGKGGDQGRSRQVMKSKGYMGAKELVYDAILRRATDIHLEPKEDEMSVRIRIDGVMYPSEPFDRSIGEAIVNIFKVLGAMDITEKRRPQDGSFRAILDDAREIDFRAATQGTRHGEKLTLRLLDQSNAVASLEAMGMRKKVLSELREIVHQPHGLMLVCGPTGAGKSTTLYACLNDLDSYQSNIITVEDPVEYKMDNVNQIEINQRAGQSFAASLRSILRQDPDVVMVGEIRDKETAEIACQAANTGHMVFSTVHANDTITALYRIMELGVEPFMVANSISSILGQRLARRLCPDCKEAYKPKPEILKQAGLPANKVENFYRPPKKAEMFCETCGGLGFKGRIGVFELLVVTDRMRDLIREKANVSAVKAEARKNGMLYMREEGLRLVAMGITSVEEMLRVVK
jgi:type II secretory ATPase GspE/PulE/Tfp pilus assembly ATPase PilB-like protein